MSLGSEFPEKFDEALESLVVDHAVKAYHKTWHTETREELREKVWHSLSDLRYSNDPGDNALYRLLTDNVDAGAALNRFHESLGMGG